MYVAQDQILFSFPMQNLLFQSLLTTFLGLHQRQVVPSLEVTLLLPNSHFFDYGVSRLMTSKLSISVSINPFFKKETCTIKLC